jgi:calcium/calmodulin-dependent protein kinase (CaM kinase) II
MPDTITDELLKLTQRLLDGIAGGDWATYQELCDPTLTSFEAEAHGVLVEGLAFHKFYFDLGGIRGPHHTTISAPHVRVMGDTAVVAYIRHVQRLGPDGLATTVSQSETRIWQRRDGRWRHVHFHRSPLG